MICYASPSSAPSAHPHVSYTSHPHSKDVNSSTGTHSEASDGIAKLEARMTVLETETKNFKTEISEKIDTLGLKLVCCTGLIVGTVLSLSAEIKKRAN